MWKPQILRLCLICVLWTLVPCVAAVEAVPLWGRWEFTLRAATPADPSTDVSIELTSPSGKVFRRDGFWDGDGVWGVRFMPTETGTWRFRSQSVPPVAGLDGESGQFTCGLETGTTIFLRHGPLRVSESHRFFEHSDGTPFFWMGDTTWYGAILSRKEDWDTYLTDRAAKRFDVVHFNAVAPRNGVAADENGEISFAGGTYPRLTSRFGRLRYAVSSYLGLQVDRILMNPKFYQRLDQRIDAVNSKGLLAAIVMTWGLRDIDSGNALPETEVVRLMRYLDARYGANHVVWIMTGDNRYQGSDGERWKRIGRSAFLGRPHAPVTTHPIGWPWDSFGNEQWLDFLTYQSGHGDDEASWRWLHSGPPSKAWRELPPRPIINLEPPYEGHLGYQSHQPHSDFSTRRAIYWSLLNTPTAGVTYGAHGVWSWHTAVGQPPTDHASTGVAKTWREALPFPGSTQMKYVMELFSSVAWWKLRPDPSLLIDQPGLSDATQFVSASRSDDRDLAVIYLPVGNKIRVRDGILMAGLQAQWFEPRTGRKSPAQASQPGEFQAPDHQDWVLLLSK